MERWYGKIAIVTGASAGIGKSITKTLISYGLNIIGLSNREDQLKILFEELKNSKGTFYYKYCDFEKKDDILKAFEFINDKFGSIDILINNAGIIREGTFANVKTEDLRATLYVNLLAPAIFMKETLKIMSQCKNEAHIININSIAGINAISTAPVNIYPATKFGLRGLTDTFKEEIILAKNPIRVTSIHPGIVSTEIVDDSVILKKIMKSRPTLKSKDIADCVVFALSAPPHVQIDEIIATGVSRE